MESFEHKLQKFDPGVVWLDGHNRVLALNTIASSVLGVTVGDAVGTEILQLHPEKSRDKVQWLLESASCPVTSAPPSSAERRAASTNDIAALPPGGAGRGAPRWGGGGCVAARWFWMAAWGGCSFWWWWTPPPPMFARNGCG